MLERIAAAVVGTFALLFWVFFLAMSVGFAGLYAGTLLTGWDGEHFTPAILILTYGLPAFGAWGLFRAAKSKKKIG